MWIAVIFIYHCGDVYYLHINYMPMPSHRSWRLDSSIGDATTDVKSYANDQKHDSIFILFNIDPLQTMLGNHITRTTNEM